MLELNKVYYEPNQVTLEKLDDDLIDLTVTSPPYDDIKESLNIVNNKIVKNYNIIPHSRDYDGYDWDIKRLAELLYLKTKRGGVVVWIMKDPVVKSSESLASCYTRIIFQEAGFITHDTMIFEKHNFSNPCKNRFHDIFEYMYIFSKGKPKTFNSINDRENKYAGQTTYGKNTVRQKDGTLKERVKKVYTDFGRRFNIFKYKVGTASGDDKTAFKHPAIFPLQLAQDHINIWSNSGDLIYDPFMGSGTVALASLKLNRNYIGSEISKKYGRIIEKRLSDYLAMKK
jgi:DNA modification methylase